MTDKSGRWVEIEHRRPVGWFDLRQLMRTGFMTAASMVVGSMTGRRELLAALDIAQRGPDPEPYRYDQQAEGDESRELWIDYIADTGDGWNATHSIGWLAGRDWLFLGEEGDEVAQPITGNALTEAPHDSVDSALKLPRSDILIFGGDEVYPAADASEYKARLHDPFFAARPWGSSRSPTEPATGGSDLFAIPGNHDWYDGLTSFIRVFCQAPNSRWIGSWQPRQHRSYFSIKLPHGFWIWGIDTALEEDIDPPQIAYFRKQSQLLSESDQVVLCTPMPAWVDLDASISADESASVAWIKLDRVVKMATKRGAGVPVVIAGDMHHFARHTLENGERQFITCGGGGAFTLGTGIQPDELALPDGQKAERTKRAFPGRKDSEHLKLGALWMFKSSYGFCMLLAGFQVLLIWLMQKSSQLLMLFDNSTLPFGGIEMPWLERMAATARLPSETGLLLGDAMTIIVRSPSVILLLVILVSIFIAFSRSGASRHLGSAVMTLIGIGHMLLQTAVAWTIGVLLVRIAQPLGLETVAAAVLITGFLLASLWLVCGGILGIYLLAANKLFGAHEQEVYSCQAIEDWKSFLRMRVSHDGLTIYPIGLRQCVRDWNLPAGIRRRGPSGLKRKLIRSVTIRRNDKIWVPDGATHVYEPVSKISPELIEKPIYILRKQ